jgi:small basic protein
VTYLLNHLVKCSDCILQSLLAAYMESLDDLVTVESCVFENFATLVHAYLCLKRGITNNLIVAYGFVVVETLANNSTALIKIIRQTADH